MGYGVGGRDIEWDSKSGYFSNVLCGHLHATGFEIMPFFLCVYKYMYMSKILSLWENK